MLRKSAWDGMVGDSSGSPQSSNLEKHPVTQLDLTGLNHVWLVVDLPLLKNMSSSVGMMKFPTEWKNKIHVPKTK